VRDEDVVGVRAVVDEIDHRRDARALVEVADRTALDDDAVEEVHDRAGDRRADAVVREQVELRDDLAQVLARLLPRLLDGDVVVLRVGLHGLHDLAAAEDFELDFRVAAFELEAIDADAPVVLQPPGVPLRIRDDRDGEHDRNSGGDEEDVHVAKP
jgi:hypothetical protein